MSLRKIAGHDIWVAEQGTGPGTRLMLHCSLASHGTLLPLAAALPPARTILFDLPGHGRSGPWDGVQEYQRLAVDICVALLDGAEGPIEVIGHSFGATAALHLALAHPDLVDRLVLMDSVFFAAANPVARAGHIANFAPFIAALQDGDRARAAEIFLGLWGAPGTWQRMSAAQQKDAAGRIHIVPASAAAMDEDCYGQLAPGRLEGLACPVRLIEGGATDPVVHAINDTFEARIPNTTRTRVAGAGHMVPITHVVEVVKALA